MNVPAIETRDLHMHYGQGRTEVRALDGVDLRIEAGEMVSVMGPSGSGKSTLLHIIGALESPTSGTIAVAGRQYEGLSDKELTALRRDHIGFVFQFFNLLPSLTAEENVTLPAVIAKRRDPAIRERARLLLQRVELADRAHHLPAELSGGQQQRVSIARALLLSPELVLADEPTGNLDSKSSREVLRVLRELNQEEGHTIVMVTHDAAAAATADRVIFLRDGRLAGEVEGGSTRRAADYLASLQAEAEREPVTV
ncbi:MAG TPA: ABC transporter ATP-binding protein [Thermoleophilaceae bacterium]|nr:ABC transporter ATP-binding protein [Thermoleophilaceae bacterium]